MSHAVLMIGIDGGCWSVLRPAMERGFMPHLRRLTEGGASGVLTSTVPAITPAAWSSLQTGMNPGQTGVFEFYRWNKTDRTSHWVSSRDLPDTLWELAGRSGYRLGAINVPMTYPPRPVNGFLVTGLLTPSLDSDWTYPAGLRAELLRAVPEYRIVKPQQLESLDADDLDAFLAALVAVMENRRRLAGYLLAKERLDLFMVHFLAPDILQHRLWPHLEPDHPLYRADRHERILAAFYRKLDELIAALDEEFHRGSDAGYTFVVSDHGFQSHVKRFHLGCWLREQGYLRVNPRHLRVPLRKRITRRLGLGKWLARLASPRAVGRLEKTLRMNTDLYDWDHSQVFCQGSSGEGFIFLLEDPPSENLVRELSERLKEIRDPQTDRPVVSRVYRRDELYHGRALEKMPDLVVVPADGYSFAGQIRPDSRLWHPVNARQDRHLGKHHPDGIFIAAGPAVASRSGLRADITDITPTVLHLMGVPVPAECDGRVRSEWFGADFRPAPPRTTPDDGKRDSGGDGSGPVYSSQDERTLESRLEDLGYL